MMILLKIVFSRPRGSKIGSFAIRAAEKRPYSHACVSYVDSISLEPIIAQASHGYVNQANVYNFLLDNTIVKVYSVLMSEEKFVLVKSFIDKNLGKEYSFSQLILIVVKKICGFEVNSYNREDCFICSEFVGYLCRIVGIPVPTELDYFTPSDLDKVLDNYGVPYEVF